MDTPLLKEDALGGSGSGQQQPPPGRRSKKSRQPSIQSTRPSYFASLRQGSVPSLRLVDDGLSTDDTTTTTTPSSSIIANRLSKSDQLVRFDGVNFDGPLDIPKLQRQYTTLRRIKYKPADIERNVHVEVRLKDYSYHVPLRVDAPNVKDVITTSPCYVASMFVKNVGELFVGKRRVGDLLGHYEQKWILKDINLSLKPGKTYIVMGPPSSGKTSLLKAIAGRLRNKSSLHSGCIEYNGVSIQDAPQLVLQNVVSYVGQLDYHAPFLTVQETFDFAADCRIGVKKKSKRGDGDGDATAQEHVLSENLTIDGLDLAICRETYVGDANNRGVSGGQRRRVTVGEMMVGQNAVACADEISTGLDAAVTYDIVSSIVKFAKAAGTTRVVSLLQPGPETFSLFDEVILLSEGQLVYAGPVEEVASYFASLGYEQPDQMDLADFLQSVTTPDGSMFINPDESPLDHHYNASEFAQAFLSSSQHERVLQELQSPLVSDWNEQNLSLEGADEERLVEAESSGVPSEMKRRYSNSFMTSVKLNVKRNLTLLKRDKEFLIGKAIENLGMGIGMALIFLQAAAFPSNVNGSTAVADFWAAGCPYQSFDEEGELEAYTAAYDKLLAGTYSSIFLTAFHVLLGTLTGTPDEVDGRLIFYKLADARFFEAGAYLLGKQISQLPLLALEIVAFGLPFYFISGLAYEARAFFVYLFILIAYKFALRMLYGVLAMTLPKKANVQGVGAFIYLLLTLTGGFVVYPNTLPPYWKWLFYANPMAWALQGMASNQFLSSAYLDYNCYNSNLGQLSLENPRGWQFEGGMSWVGYTFAFLLSYTVVFGIVTWLAMKYVRIEPERQHVNKNQVSIGECKKTDDISIPFTPVDLSFENLTYEVTASTSKETLRLLNEVSGVFKAGRMCALMGSSGAGKTTLMDVIAMRKVSGEITGKIELNGFEQERTSFLRSSGYVEQFDVQQPELTVRETVEFSARLRLDASDPAIGDDATKIKFVDHVLETMELTDIQTLQVGSFEEGGLTFEQRKRLAIACELAGSPSVIFLDEPTSGLDSRGALVVIRAMRRIADSGRTVVATIHQPSAAVFEMFDDLILLKKGGNVVYFGELGEESSKLVQYFEERGARPIERQENPAAWVLRAYAGENVDEDFGKLYKSSDLLEDVHNQIQHIRETTDPEKKLSFASTFSTSAWERIRLMVKRMSTIYRRSASYNTARILVAILYAFLLGSVFINTAYHRQTVSWTENDAVALIGTVFLSLNVIGTTAMTMAIPVAKRVRDVFYKHRASGMIGHNATFIGMATAELPYLALISLLFVLIYCATAGIFTDAKSFGLFFLFFFLHLSSYAYFAQCFMCLVRDEKTVGALQGVWIGLNLFYAGFVVLPQNFFSFFWLGLWINASRYALEGIVFSQFDGITTPVVAHNLSPYWFHLECWTQCDMQEAIMDRSTCVCQGSLIDFSSFYFGGKFSEANRGIDVGVLVGWNLLALFGIWLCLKKFNYVNT